MTVLKIETVYGEDFYRIDADERAVQEAVNELEAKYAETPEEEQDGGDKADYIINGLEQRGFDPLLIVDMVTVDAKWP